jgi:hypothetical protein
MYTEIVSLHQDDLKVLFELFPQFIDPFVHLLFQIRWSIFVRCVTRRSLVYSTLSSFTGSGSMSGFQRPGEDGDVDTGRKTIMGGAGARSFLAKMGSQGGQRLPSLFKKKSTSVNRASGVPLNREK